MRRFFLMLLALGLAACEIEKLEPVPPSATHPGESASAGPNEPPVASVDPNIGSGPEARMTFRFEDPDGVRDLSWGQVLIHAELEGASACYVHWENAAGKIYIRNDAGDALIGPAIPGSGGVLENSQCRIDTTLITVAIDERSVSLSTPFRFAPSFTGRKLVFLRASDFGGHTTEWKEGAVWEIP